MILWLEWQTGLLLGALSPCSLLPLCPRPQSNSWIKPNISPWSWEHLHFLGTRGDLPCSGDTWIRIFLESLSWLWFCFTSQLYFEEGWWLSMPMSLTGRPQWDLSWSRRNKHKLSCHWTPHPITISSTICYLPSPLPHVLKKITRHCWNKYSTQLSCQGAYFINQMGKKWFSWFFSLQFSWKALFYSCWRPCMCSQHATCIV